MSTLVPLRVALMMMGKGTGNSIRKLTLTSAKGGVGSRVSFNVLVEPSNVTVCKFPIPSLSGIQPKAAQPVVGTENDPRRLVSCVVVPHPLVTTESRADD